MKRVAIITNIPAPYRIDFFYYLQENNKEFDFIIIYSSTKEDNREWSIDNNKIINSKFLKSLTLKIKKKEDNKYIHIPYDTIKVLNEINPDVVVASEYNPTVLQALAWCKSKKRKFVSWSDGTLNSEKNINIIQKLARKIVISNANSYIASSSKTKEAQIHYGAKEDKIKISYLSVDIDKYLFVKKKYKNKNLLYVGSLIKRKGVDLLLGALSNLDSNYRLTIVGEGPEKENLIKQAKRLNIADNIEFVGFKEGEELKKYYKKSDIFILPTREDCFGLVLLEAICSSLVVISSEYADGASDLIVNNESGYIVNPEDSKEFADKIKMLIDNLELVEEFQRKSTIFIEKFKFENTSINFIEAIKE